MKLLISALETSADMHAAKLLAELKKKIPELQAYGLGSEHLQQQDMRIIKDMTKRSTVGVIEPLKHILPFLWLLRRIEKMLIKERPAAVLCVDAQGFNLILAAQAKKLGIPVIYYISPQEWLWGTKAGGEKVLEVVDKIIAIFPEEADFYRKLGGDVIFNGHPLSCIVKADKSASVFRRKYKLKKPLLGFFPGSRTQELKMLLPVFEDVARKLEKKYQPVFVAANDFARNKMAKNGFPILPAAERYNVMQYAEVVITATGTTTLETALLATPMIAAYRFSPFSYWLIKTLYGHKLPRFKALPNMLAGKMIIPELIQKDCRADEIIDLIKPANLKKMRAALKILRKKVYQPQVLRRNAAQLAEYLKNL